MKTLPLDGHSRHGTFVVLVAHSHALVRDGLKLLLTQMIGEVEFVEAGSGTELLRIGGSHPELRFALVDLDIPGLQEGLRLMDFAQRCPRVPLVLISAASASEAPTHLSRIEVVSAVLSRNADSSGLRAGVEAALAGRRLPFAAERGNTESAVSGLTPRQEEIRELLRQGMSNKMIASVLGISAGTVKNHISSIFKVLNATNRTQAARVERGR